MKSNLLVLSLMICSAGFASAQDCCNSTAPKVEAPAPQSALEIAKMSIAKLESCNKILTGVVDEKTAKEAVTALDKLTQEIVEFDKKAKNVKATPEEIPAMEKELENVPVIVNSIIANCQRIAKAKLNSDDLKKAILSFSKTTGIDSIVEEHLTIKMESEPAPQQ